MGSSEVELLVQSAAIQMYCGNLAADAQPTTRNFSYSTEWFALGRNHTTWIFDVGRSFVGAVAVVSGDSYSCRTRIAFGSGWDPRAFVL